MLELARSVPVALAVAAALAFSAAATTAQDDAELRLRLERAPVATAPVGACIRATLPLDRLPTAWRGSPPTELRTPTGDTRVHCRVLAGDGGGEDDAAATVELRWVQRTPATDLVLVRGDGAPSPTFRFETAEDHRDLWFGDRAVWRQLTRYDAERHEATHKTFHHVFARSADAADGTFLTKGPGGAFSHHRGLFAGWSRVRVDGKRSDFWHCADGSSQRHRAFDESREFTGPVAARSVCAVDWITAADVRALSERRTTTTWHVGDDRVVIDTTLELTAPTDLVLNGDPQHAGFQFRAAQEAHDRKGETRYERNVEATGGKNDVWTDCRWAVLRFPIGDRTVTAAHFDHPDNPRNTRYSTRDYGRFGAFPKVELSAGEPTVLRYRIIVVDGPVDDDAADWEAAWRDFATPIGVTVN